MKRKVLALAVLLGSLSLAQDVLGDDSHTITINIPPYLEFELDALDYLFDFGDGDLDGTETVSIGSNSYTKASLRAFENFLQNVSSNQFFAPTSVTVELSNGSTGSADYGTITVRTTRYYWTVQIDAITGSYTLGNERIHVLTSKVSGKGASSTSSPTPLSSTPLVLFGASSAGGGESVYRLYYLLDMQATDIIPDAGISDQLTIDLLLTSP